LSGIVDDEIGLAKVFELFRGRSDQHVVLRARKSEYTVSSASSIDQDGRARLTMNKAW
jgi:hypothetical protein